MYTSSMSSQILNRHMMWCAVVRSVQVLCQDVIKSPCRQPATKHHRYGPSVDSVVCNIRTHSYSSTPLPLPFCLFNAEVIATACNHIKAQAVSFRPAALQATAEKPGPNSMETPLVPGKHITQLVFGKRQLCDLFSAYRRVSPWGWGPTPVGWLGRLLIWGLMCDAHCQDVCQDVCQHRDNYAAVL